MVTDGYEDVNAVARSGLQLGGALRQPACGDQKQRCLVATRDPSLLTFKRAATHWYDRNVSSPSEPGHRASEVAGNWMTAVGPGP